MKISAKVSSIILAILLLSVSCEKEPDPNDPVDIPDPHFLNALIEDGVDTNEDGLISYSEAEEVTKIYLDPDTVSKSKGKISSLEGIKAFINLDTLHFCGNQVTHLDVSSNTELSVLICWNSDKNDQLEYLNVSNNRNLRVLSVPGNQIASLDISRATELERLECTQNQLSSLDVSMNTKLEDLGCADNQLSGLDVSKNTALNYLYCNENQLTTLVLGTDYNFELYSLDCSANLLSKLDITGYRKLEYLGIKSMPTLYEVCVWYDPLSPPFTFDVDTTGSPNVHFTKECSK